MNKIFVLTICLLFCIGFQLHAQEICDNAVDDDGDGLIDLNDEECVCNTLVPSSLIPNPSFEDMTCCPMENERLDCAVSWIQASAPTTDYVHTCGGFLGNTSIPATAPLPFPDGEGGVGFRDGQGQVGSNYKEYVGACLTEPMVVGDSYRLDFFVGFRNNVPGSKNLKIALFASTQCSDLPFGGNSIGIGCPANTGNYVQLGEMDVSGSNEWVNVVFEFEADQAYEVIILGPSCSPHPNFQLDPYFYLDRLALAESSEFGQPFESVTGSICENDLILQVEDNVENTYQWYQDGIALIGETNASLLLSSLANTEGPYLVVISGPEGCQFSQVYNLLIPPYYEIQSVDICETEQYVFGLDTLTSAGFYERLLAATDGCDSIIQLTLNVNQPSSFAMQDTFCRGDVYALHDISTSEAGIYFTTISNVVGCDSVITLSLTELGQGIGIEIAEKVVIELGDRIDLSPVFFDPIYTDFTWTDENGNLIGNELRVYSYQPVRSTTVFLEATNSHGCSLTDSLRIEVLSIYNMYVPNVFSPDGNGVNDFFRFYAPASVERIRSFSIFDRWGGLAFEDHDISDMNNYVGWDGMVKGEKANQGVYCYLIHALFLDGEEKIIAGDLTLLR